MPATRTCQKCGAALSGDALKGLCPNCLADLGFGLGSEEAPTPESTAVVNPATSLDEGPGARIGHYKLLQQIGEGGCGVVYMAEQTEPVRRMVALKVMKPGMDSAQVLARFEAERQALALMDHPNIARVLDAGTTPTGRPYFVMDLVKGVPITRFCDKQRLSIQERLDLFMPVCQAIQHAHQKGIIHRDIKPSNVMVALYDGRPVPKVIDFGVAKAIGQRLTERTLFTQFGAMVGTFEYMSPEQAELNQLDIDTRSDIYSLGVLLYELLTGTTPLTRETAEQAALDELLRRIREEEPPKPSTRLTQTKDRLPSVSAQRKLEPAQLKRLLRGELDWIVMKCLDKDRNRRYETANGLALDLQRYLKDEAVLAGPPTARYRLKKFVRKHRRAVVAAAGFVALLTVATVVSTALGVWANQERSRAERAQAQAKEEERKAVLAREEATEKLWASYLAQARAGRSSARVGRRFDSLEAVRKAAEIRPHYELRNEAIASLALFDLKLEKEWEGYPPGTHMIAFDHNLQRYARGDDKGNITVRRVDNDQEICFLPGPARLTEWVMRFSPDGEMLAATYQGSGAGVWNLKDRRTILNVSGVSLDALDFSPDSRVLVAGQRNGSISFYDLGSGEALKRLNGLPSPYSIRFHPHEPQMAISSLENPTINLQNIEDGTVLKSLSLPKGSRRLEWSPDGKLLACTCDDLLIYVWNPTTANSPTILKGHTSIPEFVAFDATSDILASYGWDGLLRLWDLNTSKPLLTVPASRRHIRFSRDSSLLTLPHRSGKVALYSVVRPSATRSIVGSPGAQRDERFIDMYPSGRLVASVSVDGIRFWELEEMKEIAVVPISGLRSGVFDPRGEALITSGSPGLSYWPIRSTNVANHCQMTIGPPKLLARFSGQGEARLAPDGRHIAVDAGQHGVLLDLEKPSYHVQLEGSSGFDAPAISRDSKWVAARISNPPNVTVWDTQAGRRLKTLPVEDRARRCAFSPDSKWLAAAGTRDAGEYYIWETATWRLIHKLTTEGLFHGRLAFDPDGSLLAVVYSETGGIQLIDPHTGKALALLEGPDSYPPGALCFSPDGSKLVALSKPNVIEVWDLRFIREQLKSMGLDWDTPPLPPEQTARAVRRLSLTVLSEGMYDPAEAADSTAAMPERFPPRDRQAKPNLIDLSPYYNGALTAAWRAGAPGDDLASLPRGLQNFAGVEFDVRGLIQLSSSRLKERLNPFPERVDKIKIGLKCQRLHLLQGSGHSAPDGTQVGTLAIRYADGSQLHRPIMYGEDVSNRWAPRDGAEVRTLKRAVVAWTGTNATVRGSNRILRLYKTSWENPLPDVQIESIDYVSAMTSVDLFLIAITAE